VITDERDRLRLPVLQSHWTTKWLDDEEEASCIVSWGHKKIVIDVVVLFWHVSVNHALLLSGRGGDKEYLIGGSVLMRVMGGVLC
jgi:hypothetical protein